jgi:ubiquinone/menaquinone biosynthesis C-methylase UbiE
MLKRVLEPEVMDTAEEASAYDAMDHAAPNAAFVQRLVELGAGGKMLDIGTGPGHVPILVCERISGCRIVAVDLAETMLTIARRKLAATPFGDRITFQLADAKALPFGDGEFDAVFSNTILHHVPDPRLMLAEAKRVLKSGGVLLIRDLFRPPIQMMLDRIVQTHARDCTPGQRGLFAASLHAALTPAELEELAAEAGFKDFDVVIDSDRHMSLQSRR